MSTVTIRLPTPLRGLTGGQGRVPVGGTTVGEALRQLEEIHPGIQGRVLDAGGNLRGFVNVFLGETDIRRLEGLETSLPPGAELSVLPAVAGGSG